MNTYCAIYELKPERIEQYVQLHRECPDWQLRALRDAGAHDLEIYLWGSYCIITYACERDFADFIDRLSESADNTRWQQLMNEMFVQKPILEGTELKPLEKIFSLARQLDTPGRAERSI